MGDGDDGSAGVIAIRGADGVDGGEDEGERDVVPLIALMTDASGDEDGAGVGDVSLNGEGDPKSDVGGVPVRVSGEGDGHFFRVIAKKGLLPASPSAMSASGRRWCDASSSSSLPAERGDPRSTIADDPCCSRRPSSESESESESSPLSTDASASPRSTSRPRGNGRGNCAATFRRV